MMTAAPMIFGQRLDQIDEYFDLEFLFDPLDRVELFQIELHRLHGEYRSHDQEANENPHDADCPHDRQAAAHDHLQRAQIIAGSSVLEIGL